MTATATPSTNGRPQRKQLGDQLDRLDSIIDALAEGLPGAVADACRDGARQAVKDVILELLTNPELRTLIAGLAPPAQPFVPPPAAPATAGPAKPSLWTRVKAKAAAVRAAAVQKCTAASAAVAVFVRPVAALMPLKKVLLIGTGVGVAAGVLSYVCPHGLSAVIAGVGAACTAVAAQAAVWVRRSLAVLGLGKAD